MLKEDSQFFSLMNSNNNKINNPKRLFQNMSESEYLKKKLKKRLNYFRLMKNKERTFLRFMRK